MSRSHLATAAIGLIAGAATQLNWLAQHWRPDHGRPMVWTRIAAGAAAGLVAAVLLHALLRAIAARLLPAGDRESWRRADWVPFLSWLLVLAGAAGVPVGAPFAAVIAAAFAAGHVWLLSRSRQGGARERDVTSISVLSALFFLSGFAALIYQVIWQRVLFSAFGVNIESTTVVVAVFMLGLGLGSLLGGYLSRRLPGHLPHVFLAAEIGIGLFGLWSLELIHGVSAATVHNSLPVTAAVVFGLLAFPTMMMGATLPVLVTHLLRHYQKVGSSVGMLYFINTLGSAVACFATSDVLFVLFGLSTSVRVAAGFNLAVGTLVFLYARTLGRAAPAQAESAPAASEPPAAPAKAA